MVMECNLSRDARGAVDDLLESMLPGPADPDDVCDRLELISLTYPEVISLATIPFLVTLFEPIVSALT